VRRVRAITLALAVVPAVLGGCGLGEKEAYADRVAAATQLAIDAGTVSGTISATIRATKAPLELPPEIAAQRFTVESPLVLDLASQRSLLETNQLLHDDVVLHLKRADAEENDARPWLTLDIADLDDDAALPFSNSQPSRSSITAFAIPPAVLVDLVAGALTGSIEDLGAEDIDGTPVRGYKANFDLEKMLNDTREDAYDDDRREAVERAFESVDIDATVHAGRVWLTDSGLPRRLEFVFDEVPRRRWGFEVTVVLDLVEWGVPAQLSPPSDQETIRISSITRLMTELGRSVPMPEIPPTLPAGDPETPIPAEQPAPEGAETEEVAA
jgi:hypothetical protein